jgi:hypothetical protein
MTSRFTRAHDLLKVSEPMVEHLPALADVRESTRALRSQLDTFLRFRTLLDTVRFESLIINGRSVEQARHYCHELIDLYDQIESRPHVAELISRKG